MNSKSDSLREKIQYLHLQIDPNHGRNQGHSHLNAFDGDQDPTFSLQKSISTRLWRMAQKEVYDSSSARRLCPITEHSDASRPLALDIDSMLTDDDDAQPQIFDETLHSDCISNESSVPEDEDCLMNYEDMSADDHEIDDFIGPLDLSYHDETLQDISQPDSRDSPQKETPSSPPESLVDMHSLACDSQSCDFDSHFSSTKESDCSRSSDQDAMSDMIMSKGTNVYTSDAIDDATFDFGQNTQYSDFEDMDAFTYELFSHDSGYGDVDQKSEQDSMALSTPSFEETQSQSQPHDELGDFSSDCDHTRNRATAEADMLYV